MRSIWSPSSSLQILKLVVVVVVVVVVVIVIVITWKTNCPKSFTYTSVLNGNEIPIHFVNEDKDFIVIFSHSTPPPPPPPPKKKVLGIVTLNPQPPIFTNWMQKRSRKWSGSEREVVSYVREYMMILHWKHGLKSQKEREERSVWVRERGSERTRWESCYRQQQRIHKCW